ncbi:patatin-like phospholipase family protein [Agaribacter flavus]|uniref:Patatin-like phospholipase family protein n=1 Tax=Agaribacter flavus TaxID=1902781 RepID=A0ABV7FS95_9ALTE
MTILKLGFAMGGGVSLGTFNAGALSQTIKLAILYGRDDQGQAYEKVEIDVFSGASAGAISLALMLRALAAQTDEQITDAKISLTEEFGDDFTSLDEGGSRQQALIASQIMADIQRKVWVEEVSLDKLLAPISEDINHPQSLKYSAGLLNRGALENIAKHILDGSPAISAEQKLLADRVLFASSLANLTPILKDARKEFAVGQGGHYALADGMTSYTHRETRVFDLYFGKKTRDDYLKDKTRFPSRWTRYHLASSARGVVDDMRENKDLWYKIISTAMASGAFPMAFEPVVLERYKYEFGANWPEELTEKNAHNFSYIDGGVFNNEPIRDAFKLASFIDAYDERENTQRCIVFVDPAVTPLTTNFKVPVHTRFKLSTPLLGDNVFGDFDGVDLEAKTSLDRLVGHIQSIVGAVFMQSRALEGDKIFAVRKQMQLRNSMRDNFYKQSDTILKQGLDSPSLLQGIYQQLSLIMSADRDNVLLPSGALSVAAEARRIYREIAANYKKHAVLEIDYIEIDSELEKIRQGKDPIPAVFSWYVLLNFIQIDQSMQLGGKSENNRFIAIAPFENPSADTYDAAKPITLPGDKFMAFGGFMYQRTREVDMGAGEFCAAQALLAAGFIQQDFTPSPLRLLDDAETQEYERLIDRSIKAITARVLSMLKQSNVPVLSSIPTGLIKFAINRFGKGTPVAKQFELRIKLPKSLSHLELDGRGKVPGIGDNDIKPVKLNGNFYLITFVDYDKKTKRWSGEHVSGSQSINIDQNGFIDRHYTSINLPEPTQISVYAQYGYAVFETTLKKVTSGQSQTLEWHVSQQLVPMHEYLQTLKA